MRQHVRLPSTHSSGSRAEDPSAIVASTPAQATRVSSAGARSFINDSEAAVAIYGIALVEDTGHLPLLLSCSSVRKPLYTDGATSYASSVFASSNLASHNHTTHATPKVVTKKPAVPNYYRKLVVGSIVSISSAVCFVGLTEFMRATYSSAKFQAPFFIVYFSTTWWVVVYPVYVCVRTVATVGRPGLKNSFKEGFSVYGKEGASPRPTAVLGKVAMFTCLWVFSCYLFLRALSLKKLYYVDVVALFASKSAFVFLMSWIILQKQFLAMRVTTHFFISGDASYD
ncbi:hypothetical protein NP493_958g00007 [Ridgeia piscesae]|uniref:Uncharacterized protein n=1 Tax=Ridgeia piscesae TaxID=27915 RepID=A0AAD9NME3_RIDPI|nr:hypothetical protein NP493_958g00007 [Ridgeia piscesae]